MNQRIESLPPERREDLLENIRARIVAADRCVVVLDDDPTGTQTVYDTPVLTTWDVESLAAQLARPESMFYVLTNSRALTQPRAVALGDEIGRNLSQASEQTGRPVTVISRSDSTLRGHYPAEVIAVEDALRQSGAVHVIMPFFLQGGRLTIDDVHYVLEGEDLVPAAETPFARDATFGYQHSNLIDWVCEKRGADFDRSRVHSIAIDVLRGGDLSEIASRLASLPSGDVVVVNAVTIGDARAFALAALEAEQAGANLIYRTAASFVQAYAGLEERSLLSTDQLVTSRNRAGLIVVGSYVPKTTAQLNALLKREPGPHQVVLEVESLLSASRRDGLDQAIRRVNAALASGQDVVVYTSRKLITGRDDVSNLDIGSRVSDAIVDVVRSVDVPLRFLIAKGGITSSDVATRGLDVKRATVAGQILPGIPVWKLGPGSRFPELPYVVFPGNVGGDEALAVAYEKLRRPADD